MTWEFNINTVLLILVFVSQIWKVWLHVQIKRMVKVVQDVIESQNTVIRNQDKVVRENLTVQTNYNAVVAELVRNYHHLTIGVTTDAQATLVNLAGEVKEVVAAGVQATTDAASKLAADSSVIKKGGGT